jgi:phage-related protein (TIGR01555 family)
MGKKHRNKPQIKNVVPKTTVQMEATERVIVPNPSDVIRNAELKVSNGLADACGFGNGPGIGGGINPWGFGGATGLGVPTISDTSTAFENLRWYLVSNFRQLLSELYVEIGLVQTVVNVPVDDALRGGIMFKSKQLDEDQIKELQITMDRDDDLGTAGHAARWTRLYGGGGILILVGDQDPEEPLNLDAIGPDTDVKFRAVDMWELYWDKQNVEGYDAEIQSEEYEYFNYYSELVHKSRVLKLKGIEAPSFIRPRLRGWGVSCVESLIRSMNQYLKATDLGFEVLDEFKLDVYKIKNLVNTLMSPTGTQAIQQRIQLANWQKNYQNAVVMDAEDDFDHKQLSFAGLADAMAGIRMQVAADMRMPGLKLFGQSFSTGGLGTSSQEEMENYNSMVESEVRGKLKYHTLKMAEIKCQKLFGFIPDDLEGEWKPLRELTAKEQEEVKTQKFTRLSGAKAAGELTTKEFRDAANKGGLFDVHLDTTGDNLQEDDQLEDVLSGDAANEDPDDNDNDGKPGADESESEKVAPKLRVANRNSWLTKIEPWRSFEKVLGRLVNSADFDRASYEADGGDSWIAEGRREIFSRDFAVNQSLYDKCTAEAENLHLDWKFVVWLYRKQGGKFA